LVGLLAMMWLYNPLLAALAFGMMLVYALPCTFADLGQARPQSAPS
jgi:hypothetical protein